MVILLVILTFVVLLAAGTILERRESRERKAARELRYLAQEAVFAQDGGEPVDNETDSEVVEKES
ncbi:MAG: hypothetical protein KAH24_01445 [Holophagae bacterium]|nr:hypothetical protein [Holophagae bacterium]